MNKKRLTTTAIVLAFLSAPFIGYAGVQYALGVANDRSVTKIASTHVAEASRVEEKKPFNPSEVVRLTNLERQKVGLPPLVENPLLTQSAQLKNDDMIKNNYWTHISPQGLDPWYFIKKTGYSYQKAGENLACQQKTEWKVVSDWMRSPTHRANILDPGFKEMGVAYSEPPSPVLNSVNNIPECYTLITAHYGG